MSKKQYSTFVKYETYQAKATGVNAIALYYTHSDSEEMYTSLIRLLPGGTTVEWEVQLHAVAVDEFQN